MYLSALLIDVGANPDRPRPARLWLRNRYRVHQRLCMAFPSEQKRSADPHFLQPFEPAHFSKQVHIQRGIDAGFLYRIDPVPGSGRSVIIVQSGVQPDWEYAFQNAGHLLAAYPELKRFDPHFEPNQCLKFRVFANPVRKVCKHSRDPHGKPFEKQFYGKRVPVATGDLDKWLLHRAEPDCQTEKRFGGKRPLPGFSLERTMQIHDGYVYVNEPPDRAHGRRMRFAQYEGVLRVTNTENFRNTLIGGIGPGKAFGFGLLSVAPVDRRG